MEYVYSMCVKCFLVEFFFWWWKIRSGIFFSILYLNSFFSSVAKTHWASTELQIKVSPSEKLALKSALVNASYYVFSMFISPCFHPIALCGDVIWDFWVLLV